MTATTSPQPGSISSLIELLKQGNAEAAEKLYCRVFEEVLEHSRRRLARLGIRAEDFDAYDLVQEVLPKAIERLGQGKHPHITNRDHLWGHLFQAAIWQANNELERQLAQKRGGGRRTLNSASSPDEGSFEGPLDQAKAADTLPTDVHSLLLLIERVVGRANERERQILVLVLQGYTDKEVAERTQWSLATIERIKQSIRQRLEREQRGDE